MPLTELVNEEFYGVNVDSAECITQISGLERS